MRFTTGLTTAVKHSQRHPSQLRKHPNVSLCSRQICDHIYIFKKQNNNSKKTQIQTRRKENAKINIWTSLLLPSISVGFYLVIQKPHLTKQENNTSEKQICSANRSVLAEKVAGQVCWAPGARWSHPALRLSALFPLLHFVTSPQAAQTIWNMWNPDRRSNAAKTVSDSGRLHLTSLWAKKKKITTAKKPDCSCQRKHTELISRW